LTDAVFVHRTVLLDEAVEALAIRKDGVYVDCTFGRGGHSRLILSQRADWPADCLDKDPEAIAVATALAASDARCHRAQRLCRLPPSWTLGVAQVDGVLMDLGISSPQ
jgi:16S rRNA (cytosine1402-N4)-methyltransferase